MVQTRSSTAGDVAEDHHEAAFAGFSGLCDDREEFLQESCQDYWNEEKFGAMGPPGFAEEDAGKEYGKEDGDEEDQEDEPGSWMGVEDQEKSDVGSDGEKSMVASEDSDSVDSDDNDELPATGTRILASLPARTVPPLTIKIRPSSTVSQQQPPHRETRSPNSKPPKVNLLKKRFAAKLAQRTGKPISAKARSKHGSASKAWPSGEKKIRAVQASSGSPIKRAKKKRPPIFNVNDLEWCDITAPPEPAAPAPDLPDTKSPVKRGRGRPPLSKEVPADLTRWSVLAYVSVEEPPRVVQKTPRATKKLETPDAPPKGPFTITHETEWSDLLRLIGKYAGILQENLELETLRWSVFPPSTSAKVQSAANLRWLPLSDDVAYQDFIASGIKTTKGIARFIFSVARASPASMISRTPKRDGTFDGRLFPGSPFHGSPYGFPPNPQSTFPFSNQHAPAASQFFSGNSMLPAPNNLFMPDPSAWYTDLDDDLSDDGGSPSKKGTKKSSKKDNKGNLLAQLQPLVDFLQHQFPVGCCGLPEHSDFACYYDKMRHLHFKLDKNRFQVWAYEITKNRATTEMIPRSNKFFQDQEAVKPVFAHPSMPYMGYEQSLHPTGSGAAWTPAPQFFGQPAPQQGSGPSGSAAPMSQYFPGMPFTPPAVQPMQYGHQPSGPPGAVGAFAGGPLQGPGPGSGYAPQPAFHGYMMQPNGAYQAQPHASYQTQGAGPSRHPRR